MRLVWLQTETQQPQQDAYTRLTAGTQSVGLTHFPFQLHRSFRRGRKVEGHDNIRNRHWSIHALHGDNQPVTCQSPFIQISSRRWLCSFVCCLCRYAGGVFVKPSHRGSSTLSSDLVAHKLATVSQYNRRGNCHGF